MIDPAQIDNAFTYHSPTDEQIQKFQILRVQARQLAHTINAQCPDSREKNESMNHLDAVIMFANASIARHDNG